MSLPFSPGKLQGQERKKVLQVVQAQAKAAARDAIKPVLEEFLEAEVTAKLGREKGQARRISSQPRTIDWQCANCGCSDANQFIRDGHYRRDLGTGWGHVNDLRVPMLECQHCRHDVVSHFAILEKYQRFWMDLDQDVLFHSGLGVSLRQLQERWSATVEGSIGLRTLNERINQVEQLASCAHTAPLADVPSVIQLDGIWVTIQSEHEKIKPDTRKRQRHQRSGTKMVVLVALGFWEDGRREVLDWQIARSENHQEWEVLVHRLWERGCQLERGLQLVVRDGSGGLGEALALVYGATVREQRCIFHKLQNVSTKARSELKGNEKREERKQLMEQAAAIYQASIADEARQRLTQWHTKWQEHAPQAVVTLTRDFEQTLVFFSISGLALEWIRTTSLLERTNRELRRKFRLAVTFGSRNGAEVAVFLQVRRLHARWAGESWCEASRKTFFDL
ncbi:MAG TPA: transposase [Ktedonosporobacter sp.]|nr:transposase [Ktedonosporobacter sp.]